MDESKMQMIQFELDFNRKRLAATMEQARKKAADFAALDPSSQSARWELETIGQSMQKLAKQMGEYKSKIEAIENVLEIVAK